MEFYILIVALLIPLGIGYVLLVFLFRPKAPELALSLALAFGLGCGMLTQWMLVLDVFNIRFSVKTINTPLIFFLFICAGLVLKMKTPRSRQKRPVSLPGLSDQPQKKLRFSVKSVFAVLCVIYIVMTTSYVFWRALNIPIESYDALVKISYKAKVFFFDRKIHLIKVPHGYYPLQVPLLQTWASFVLGRWDDFWTKIFFPVYFSSYLIIQFYFLKIISSKYKALLGTCLLVSANLFVFHATIAYMDFTLMYYNCVALLLMVLWHRSPEKTSWLILAGFFSGIMTFVKSEGTIYLFIHIILLLMLLKQIKGVHLKDKGTHFLRFVIPSLSVCIAFYLYKMMKGSAYFWHDSRMIWDFNFSTIIRLPKIIAAFANDLLFSGNWSLLWFVFLFLLIYDRKRNCFYTRWFSLALGLFFLTYILLGLTTQSFEYIGGQYTGLGLSRLVLHFFPLIIPVIIFAYDTKVRPA